MFSATWPSSIQKLASEFLCNPVKVTIGSSDLSASHSVTQVKLFSYSVFSQCYCDCVTITYLLCYSVVVSLQHTGVACGLRFVSVGTAVVVPTRSALLAHGYKGVSVSINLSTMSLHRFWMSSQCIGSTFLEMY